MVQPLAGNATVGWPPTAYYEMTRLNHECSSEVSIQSCALWDQVNNWALVKGLITIRPHTLGFVVWVSTQALDLLSSFLCPYYCQCHHATLKQTSPWTNEMCSVSAFSNLKSYKIVINKSYPGSWEWKSRAIYQNLGQEWDEGGRERRANIWRRGRPQVFRLDHLTSGPLSCPLYQREFCLHMPDHFIFALANSSSYSTTSSHT